MKVHAQIAQLPVENLLSGNEFLKLGDETTLDEEGDVFGATVAAYSSNQTNEGGKSSDEEEVE